MGGGPVTIRREQGWRSAPDADARPWSELRESGLLWLINRVVFHPRGYALGLVQHDGDVVGWHLLGDGSEVWSFDGDEGTTFAAVQRTFAEHGEGGGA